MLTMIRMVLMDVGGRAQHERRPEIVRIIFPTPAGPVARLYINFSESGLNFSLQFVFPSS